MFKPENVLGIIVTDREGVIKSLSHNNDVLNSGIIGAKWYDALMIPVEESYKIEDEAPRVFSLLESEQKVSVAPSYDEKGNTSGFHILVEKMNEGEDYVQFINKVSCLGKIVPGIAHEINNPLAYVSGWLQMFYAEASDTDPKKKTYELLINEFQRIADLANSLLEFTKQTPRSKEIFDINQVAEEVITMIGYTMKNENIEIIKNLLSSEIEIYGDGNRLKQVFLNLMQNAREAMPRGGTIYVSTNLVRDNSVIIQFRDTGCGIRTEQLNNVFLPSNNAKSNGNGNGAGLGLSVCKTIIEEFGGTIGLDSKVGEGTVVSIILPKYSIRQNENLGNVN